MMLPSVVYEFLSRVCHMQHGCVNCPLCGTRFCVDVFEATLSNDPGQEEPSDCSEF